MIRQVREGDIRFIVVRPHAMDASPSGSSIIRKIYAAAADQPHITPVTAFTPQRIVMGFDIVPQECAELKYPNLEQSAYLPSEKLSIG